MKAIRVEVKLMVTNVFSLLHQVPAILIFKQINTNTMYASKLFFRHFKVTATQESQILFPLFKDPITKEALCDHADPIHIAESGKYISKPVIIEFNNQHLECLIGSNLVDIDEQTWLVMHLYPTKFNDASLDEKNASYRQHVLFNQLMSNLSSQLINASWEQLDTIIDQSLAAFGEFCGLDRCYLFKFIDNATAMTNTHEWVADGVTSYIDDLQGLPVPALPYFNRHIKSGVFQVDDVSKLPSEAHLEKAEFEREGISSILCYPVNVNGLLYGFIGCDVIRKPYHWQPYDIEYLSRIAQMLGNTIENIRNRRKLQQTQAALLEANSQLEKLANIDGLTGIANRRLFDSTLRKDIDRFSKNAGMLSLLMIDVDYFKAYNDLYGHVEGDKVLQRVSQTLTESCTGSDDLVCRYGGEEFAIILPGANNKSALNIAERIRQDISALRIEHGSSEHENKLTISVGVVTQKCSTTTTVTSFVTLADEALYRAKSAGRNRVQSS